MSLCVCVCARARSWHCNQKKPYILACTTCGWESGQDFVRGEEIMQASELCARERERERCAPLGPDAVQRETWAPPERDNVFAFVNIIKCLHHSILVPFQKLEQINTKSLFHRLGILFLMQVPKIKFFAFGLSCPRPVMKRGFSTFALVSVFLAMASLKLRYATSAFCGRAGLTASYAASEFCDGFSARRLSGGSVEEASSDGEAVPAWLFWKHKAELSEWKHKAELSEEKHKADAKEFLVSIAEARLEILQYRYHLKARGILELFIKSLTRDARLHCHIKAQDAGLSESVRKLYNYLAINWSPYARKEIWQVIFEMPMMREFKDEMQNVLASADLGLLVEKATTFHKEFHHFHHSGVRRREYITFVREHLQQGIHNQTVDPLQLEGFIKAMAKVINVNVRFVNEREVVEEGDD